MSWAIWITGVAAANRRSRAPARHSFALSASRSGPRAGRDPEGAHAVAHLSEAERNIVYRALVFIAAMLTEAGTPVIIDATAHRRLWRDLARREIPRFAEVQLIGPVDLARDRERIREPGDAPRGICACAGQPGATVPGVDVPYEPALSPELVINTDGRAREAQPLYRRALAIQETRLGPDHVAVAIVRSNLAGLYASQGKFAEAEPLYRHAMAAREKALGPAHASLAPTLDNYAVVLRHLGRTAEAEARGQIRARSERATRCSAGGNRTAPAA